MTRCFDRASGSWSEETKISAADGDSSDVFGRSVAVSGDGTTAVIGAPGQNNSNGEPVGAASRFEQQGGSWNRRQKLLAANGDAGDSFGHSVSLSDGTSTALIGALMDADPNGKQAGSAYVFE